MTVSQEQKDLVAVIVEQIGGKLPDDADPMQTIAQTAAFAGASKVMAVVEGQAIKKRNDDIFNLLLKLQNNNLGPAVAALLRISDVQSVTTQAMIAQLADPTDRKRLQDQLAEAARRSEGDYNFSMGGGSSVQVGDDNEVNNDGG